GSGNLDVAANALTSTANFLKAHGWRAGAGHQPGDANLAALQAGNAGAVYQPPIAVIGRQMDGGDRKSADRRASSAKQRCTADIRSSFMPHARDGLRVLVSDYCCVVHCLGRQMRRCEFIALLGMDVQLPIMELGKALMAYMMLTALVSAQSGS